MDRGTSDCLSVHRREREMDIQSAPERTGSASVSPREEAGLLAAWEGQELAQEVGRDCVGWGL